MYVSSKGIIHVTSSWPPTPQAATYSLRIAEFSAGQGSSWESGGRSDYTCIRQRERGRTECGRKGGREGRREGGKKESVNNSKCLVGLGRITRMILCLQTLACFATLGRPVPRFPAASPGGGGEGKSGCWEDGERWK